MLRSSGRPIQPELFFKGPEIMLRDRAEKVSSAPSGKISPRFRRLIAFCESQRIVILRMMELNWKTWVSCLSDGSTVRGINALRSQVETDLDQGFMALAHEIGHLVLPFYMGMRFNKQYKRREPLGFFVIPAEILAWMVGYLLILAVAWEYLPITAYTQFAAECVGSKIRFYFRK